MNRNTRIAMMVVAGLGLVVMAGCSSQAQMSLNLKAGDTGTYKVTIDSLVITGSSGMGKSSISVPTAAILSLAFMDRSVTFDCFGISGSFVIPQ